MVASLRDLADRLRKMPDAVDAASREVARGVEAQIKSEFASASDPWGQSWHTMRVGPAGVAALTKSGKPKRTVPGVPTKLHATGALSSSLKVTGSDGKVRVRGSAVANLYQYAWRSATFLPWGNDIGQWRAMINEATNKAVERHLNGR